MKKRYAVFVVSMVFLASCAGGEEQNSSVPVQQSDSTQAESAEETSAFPIEEVYCADSNMQDTTLEVLYDSTQDSIILLDDYDGVITMFQFNENARNLILQAIEKTIEWKAVAIENNVTQLRKVVPDIGDPDVSAMYNSGDGWSPVGYVITYRFAVLENDGDPVYYFIIQYQTASDLNTGSPGNLFIFDIGSQTDTLRMAFSDANITSLMAAADADAEQESLFN